MSGRRVATNPATTMLLTLTSWLGLRSNPSAPRPMLIRVCGSAPAPRTVEIQACWTLGGGREIRTTPRLFVSDGVCLLAWVRDAKSVTLDVDLPQTRTLVIDRHRYQGEVLEARVPA